MSVYKVVFEKRAKQDLTKIPQKYLIKIKRKIDLLGEDPRASGCKKLQGFKNLYRIRSGNYRIIYQVIDDQVIVIIVAVKHRRSSYRSLG